MVPDYLKGPVTDPPQVHRQTGNKEGQNHSGQVLLGRRVSLQVDLLAADALSLFGHLTSGRNGCLEGRVQRLGEDIHHQHATWMARDDLRSDFGSVGKGGRASRIRGRRDNDQVGAAGAHHRIVGSLRFMRFCRGLPQSIQFALNRAHIHAGRTAIQ